MRHIRFGLLAAVISVTVVLTGCVNPDIKPKKYPWATQELIALVNSNPELKALLEEATSSYCCRKA